MESSITLGDWATWTAAAVALVSAFLTIWWPWFSRPGVKWVPERVIADPQIRMNGEQINFMQVRFVQVGDGTAYNIRIESRTSRAGLLSHLHVAHLQGDEMQDGPVETLKLVPAAGNGERIVATLNIDDRPLSEQMFNITWNQPPVRWPWEKKRDRAQFSGQQLLDQSGERSEL